MKSKQLKKLIDTFYELSIIELHSRPLIPEKIDVSLLLKETLLLYLEDFNQKEITVHLNISDSIFLVADKNHLTQIIINLIDNAIKYATNYFSVELYEENNQLLLLFSNETVPNTKLNIEHVTDKFYTGNLSRTDESTGVGLYMVEQLILQLGGKLSISFENNVFLVRIIL